MTEKKKFEKPSMQVIELQQRQQLLAGSNPNALNNPDDYLQEDDPFADEP